MNLKSVLQYVVFVGIGFLILMLMFKSSTADYLEECALKGIPESECSLFDKIVADFSETNLTWIIVILIIYMISNIFRSLRWHQLVEPLGYKPKLTNTFGSLMIGYFANLGLPRIGEFVRAGLVKKYENIPFEQAFATIIIERVVDVIMLLLCISITFLLAYSKIYTYLINNLNIPAGLIISLITFGFLSLLALIYIYKTKIKNPENNSPLIQKIKSLIDNFVEGLLSIKDVKRKGLFALYSIGIWVCYFLMTYFCFFASDITSHLSPVAGLVAFTFGTLGIVFPSPGGMGSYHFLVGQALVIYGISSIDAFSFANIIFFTIQIFGNVLFGGIMLLILPFFNKSK